VPVVPSVQGPSVAEAPLSNARAQGAPSLEAFGGGQAVRAPDLSGLTRVAQDLHEQAFQKANQVAILGATTQLTKAATDLQVYAQQQRGENALAVPDKISSDWQNTVTAIRGSLANDAQRSMFDQHAASAWNGLYETTAEHVAAETQRLDGERTQAFLETTQDHALQNYTNPAVIDGSVARQRAALEDFGRRQGLPRDVIDHNIATQTSKTYATVVSRMLDEGNDLAAASYYATVQDKLTGSDQEALAKPLEIGSVRGESQRQGDAIMQSATTLTDGLAQAAKLTDPRVREETEQRVRQAFSDQAASMRQQRQEAYQQAGQILEKTQSIDSIPPTLLAQLSVEDRRELTRREKELRNPVRASNTDVYTSLMNMATLNSATQAQFLTEDLSKYRDQLSDPDYRRLQNKKFSLQQRNTDHAQSDSTRAAKQREKEAKHAALVQQLLGGKIPASVTPGAPLGPAAPASAPMSTTPPANGTVAPAHGPGRPIPATWVEKARTNPRYKQYLKDHGYAVP
jgi:hypothetical protein